MKKLILGFDAGTGAAETLLIDDNGCLGMVEGDWLYGAFKRKAKYYTHKNGFTHEEWSLMEAYALKKIIGVKDGFDPAKAKGKGRKGYLNTIINNVLMEAAQFVADQRSIWGSRQSLDAPIGDESDVATHADRVLDGADFNTNAKLWREPRCRVIRRKLEEMRKDEEAKRRLLSRLAAQMTVKGDEDEENESQTPKGDDLGVDPDTLTDEQLERRETEHRTMESMHDEAVSEVGLAEDEDEKIEMAGGKHSTSGFGDSAASVFENTLHLDVVMVLSTLEPRLREWCEKVLAGYSPTDAFKAVRFSKSNYYAYVLPKLRQAFAHLRYAL